ATRAGRRHARRIRARPRRCRGGEGAQRPANARTRDRPRRSDLRARQERGCRASPRHHRRGGGPARARARGAAPEVIRAAAVALVAALAAGAAGAPVTTSRPAVSGTLQAGTRLTANPGSWNARGAITFSFQWYRCDASGG